MPTTDEQLVVAVDDGDVAGAESALLRGASVAATDPDTGQSVMGIAFSDGSATIVRLLSQFGCDIDARQENGEKPGCTQRLTARTVTRCSRHSSNSAQESTLQTAMAGRPCTTRPRMATQRTCVCYWKAELTPRRARAKA